MGGDGVGCVPAAVAGGAVGGCLPDKRGATWAHVATLLGLDVVDGGGLGAMGLGLQLGLW